MHTRSKLLLAGLAATLLMAFAVNTASANKLSIDNQLFRVTWTNLTFFSDENETTIACPVTLEGSFNSRTIAKVFRALIGRVTKAALTNANCTGGRATILTATLPWHVTYLGFIGRLPNIRGFILLLRRPAFQIEGSGTFTQCLYEDRGTNFEEAAAGTIEVNETTGVATTLEPERSIRTPFITGGGLAPGLCPRQGGFRGTGQTTLLGSSTTRIRITLI